VRRGGALYCEDVALAELAEARAGRPAWVLSQRALEQALAGDGGPVTVAVGSVGPPEVLALVAKHDHWAAVCSAHELQLATDAGFGSDRMVATGRVRDDGFLKDALLAGVAMVSVAEADDGANLARLADALGVEQPPATGAPALADDRWLGATGGLFAAVLAPPPDLQLDASFRLRVGEESVLCLDDGPELAGTLSRLSSHGSDEVQLVAIQGTVARGGWVMLPRSDAVAVHLGDGAHAEPTTVLVRDGLWRELSPRPMPVDPGLEG
jgi:hypothetical protein